MPGPHEQPEETASGVTRWRFLELSAATAPAVGSSTSGGFGPILYVFLTTSPES